MPKLPGRPRFDALLPNRNSHGIFGTDEDHLNPQNHL